MAAPTPIAALPVDPVASVDEAVARMEGIAAALPHDDGIACFNRMYLVVTEAVRTQVTAGFFADPGFMAGLDVTFVNRYLAAIAAYARAPGSAPRSWRVLFDSRSDHALAPLQLALAGLNAHINVDLAPALVRTCVDRSTGPDHAPHHADFVKVNGILEALDQQVRESFEQGALLDLDRQFVGLDNLAGGFGIVAAREAAWVNGEVLWRLRGEPLLSGSFLSTLDRTAAFAGRALLVPLPRA